MSAVTAALLDLGVPPERIKEAFVTRRAIRAARRFGR